jgi:hypothetical protein
MVSLKTSVTGGVSYQRRDLDARDSAPALEAVGAAVARWETTKVVDDPAEHERAVRVRADASNLIRKQCFATAFGLLCPESREQELNAAVQQARAMIAEFNETARTTRVAVYVMTGKIASTDEENARAIGEEVRGLIESMSSAIDKLDPDAIREAANKANKIGAMLDADASQKVGEAVAAARKAAREITRRVEKNAEPAAIVLADIQRGAIERARIAFLDLDERESLPAEDALPAVDLGRTAELDVGEEGDRLQASGVSLTEEPTADSRQPTEEEPVRVLDLDQEPTTNDQRRASGACAGGA